MKERNRKISSEKDLTGLARILRAATEVKRKSGIPNLIRRLAIPMSGTGVKAGMGDDSGAIRVPGGYLLLSADGIWPQLLARDPHAAGRALVIANANDIYAMGGKPLAMVDVLSVSSPGQVDAVARGMRKEANRLRIPIIGGHYHPDAPAPGLAGAAVGFARKILPAAQARSGNVLLAAYDLRSGRRGREGGKTWDTHFWKTSKRVRADLNLLPLMAERKMVRAAKDISNGGVITAVYQLLESSGLGAEIDFASVPRPEHEFGLVEWLLTFPSYGFILCADQEKAEQVLSLFEKRKISCERIGKITKKRVFSLKSGRKREILFDFRPKGRS